MPTSSHIHSVGELVAPASSNHRIHEHPETILNNWCTVPNLWMTILTSPKEKLENYHPKADHKQRSQRLDSAVALAPAPIGPKAMKPQTCTVAFSGATGLNFVAGRGRGMGEAHPTSQNQFVGKIPWIHF